MRLLKEFLVLEKMEKFSNTTTSEEVKAFWNDYSR